MINYPFNLKVTYVSNIDSPISTSESTHHIKDISDVEVVCGFINCYSELTWNESMLFTVMIAGKYQGETESIVFDIV